MLSAPCMATQPWLNVAELGSTVVLTVNSDVPGAEESAVAAAEELAQFFWDAKEDFLPQIGPDGQSSLLTHELAVATAHATVCGVANRSDQPNQPPPVVIIGGVATASDPN